MNDMNHGIDWDDVAGISPETKRLYEKYGAPVDPDKDAAIGAELMRSDSELMQGKPVTVGQYTIQAVSDGSTDPIRINISNGQESDYVTFHSWANIREFVQKFDAKQRAGNLSSLIDRGVGIDTNRDGGNREKTRGSLSAGLTYAVNL